jgi:hypothetical protein
VRSSMLYSKLTTLLTYENVQVINTISDRPRPLPMPQPPPSAAEAKVAILANMINVCMCVVRAQCVSGKWSVDVIN